MSYAAPLQDIRASLAAIGASRLAETELFAEATEEMTDAILTEAGRLAADVLAPLQRAGDMHPAVLENGVVRTPPGYAEAYRQIAEGGWIGISANPESGGMGLPMVLTSAVNEMMAGSCLSLSLNPLMSQGQIEALEHHGSDALKETYLPKLVSGEWTGTMNLTEPQAGSDVGALRSKAEPNGDGSWAITGQKIYISWGDHDFGGNVCHLVLARTPDGVPGTKGISLFLVPKYLVNDDGSLGQSNRLKVISLEHKMGLHGSPTAVMQYDGATGFMVGSEFGGMAAMFTMMNNARLGVGVQGLGVAEAASQKALAYAQERRQGRTPKGSGGAIIDHADVRRMVLTQKALTAAVRGICLDTALSIDMARATDDASWAARAACLTPIAKAYGTEVGCRVAELGVQIHGGMGYIEETGAAQFYRDVRVTAIYEGTNGIQAMDLVGRKMADGGTAIRALLAEVAQTALEHAELGPALAEAARFLAEATDWMVAADPTDRFAGAVDYLHAFGLTLGAHYLMRRADGDALARFHVCHLLPAVAGLCQTSTAGSATLYALEATELAN